jgi:hypothetical protein
VGQCSTYAVKIQLRHELELALGTPTANCHVFGTAVLPEDMGGDFNDFLEALGVPVDP